MCCWCLRRVSLFCRCPVLLLLIVTNVWEVPAVLILNFGLTICSTVRCMELSVSTLCHMVFIQFSCASLWAGSFLLIGLATHVAALKILLFNTEEPDSFHSIRILPLSPPPFPSSFPPELHNRNQNCEGSRRPRVSVQGCQCSFFLLQAGELGVCSHWMPGCAVTSGFLPGLP